MGKTIYLCHCDDVRDNTVGFEPPEMAPCTGKSYLNLVGYTKSSSFLDAFVRSWQITRGKLYDSSNTLQL